MDRQHVVHAEPRAVARIVSRYLDRAKHDRVGKIFGMLHGKELRLEWVGELAEMRYDYKTVAVRVAGKTPQGSVMWRTVGDSDDDVWFTTVGHTGLHFQYMAPLFMVS